MQLAIHSIDVTILVAYLLGVAMFGIWLGRGQKDVAAYLLGGRNLPWWAVLFSIVATETSALTFIGVPAMAFGTQMPWKASTPLEFMTTEPLSFT